MIKKRVKIVHFSDTHLGFNAFDSVDKDGVNQREIDFYNSFSKVIDEILNLKPDFVLHTGDLFHKQSPKNREISFAINQFSRLIKANIPVIIIAGNHSTPKSNLISPILKALEPLDSIFVVFDEYRVIEFENIAFHCFPHIRGKKAREENLEKIEDNININLKNILLMHCSVGDRRYEEVGEWVFPKEKEYIFKKFDYVALGHWHKFQKLDENIYYSGSTERTSILDYDKLFIADKKTVVEDNPKKGFVEIDLSDKLKINFHPIELREIYRVEINCTLYDSKEKIFDYLKTIKSKEGMIIDIHLKEISQKLNIEIKKRDIEDIFKDAIFIKIKKYSKGETEIDALEARDDLKFNFNEKLNLYLSEFATNKSELSRLKSKVDSILAEYEGN